MHGRLNQSGPTDMKRKAPSKRAKNYSTLPGTLAGSSGTNEYKQHRQAATLLFSVVAARLESEVAVFLCLILHNFR